MAAPIKFSGPIKVGSLSSAPASPELGYIYYDTSLGSFQQYGVSGFETAIDTSNLIAINVGFTATGLHNITATDVQNAIANLDTAIGTLAASPTNYTPVSPAVVASHLAAIDTALGTGGTATVALDGTFKVENTADTTKKLAFDVSAVGTGTTKTITMPNSNVNLGKIATAIQSDGSVAFGADQSLAGFKITNLADPTSLQDGATKNYVDNLAHGLSWKQVVRAASTANLNLASMPSSVDGVTLTSGDRFLAKDQTTTSQNGIYIFNGSSSAATRATDANTAIELEWATVEVSADSTTQAGYIFRESNDITTLGTDPVAFVVISHGLDWSFNNGLAASGNVVNVVPGDASLGATTGSLVVQNDAAGAIVTSGSGLKVQLESTNPTLQISSNKLGAKLNAAGAIVTSSTGLQVQVDNSTVDINGSNQVEVKTGGITNTQVNSAANIDATKLGTGAISNTVFNYLTGVTSAIQTQINAKLSSVSADTAPTLGGDLTINGHTLIGIERRGATTTASVQEEYFDSISLSASQTGTTISSFTFAFASFDCVEIVYRVKQATTNNTRMGTLRVVTDGSNAVLSDTSVETASLGLSFDASISGSNVIITYTSNTNASTMRADVKRFHV